MNFNHEIKFYRGKFLVNFSECDTNDLEAKFDRWYESRAKEYFNSRFQNWIKCISWIDEGIEPKIRIRKMKSTWGSCSPKGIITINTHLIKAPKAIIDYVIAHELCHLAERCHTPKFHALLKGLIPTAESIQYKLNSQGHLYLTEQ